MTLLELEKLPVAVLVFSQKGCPACAFYLPVFRRVAAQYARCVPSFVLEADDDELADYFRIRLTPTTIVVRQGRRSSRPIGAGDASQVERLFRRAMRGLECQL